MVARYDSSKESSANLLISEDLPTEVSPTRTTLYMKSDMWYSGGLTYYHHINRFCLLLFWWFNNKSITSNSMRPPMMVKLSGTPSKSISRGMTMGQSISRPGIVNSGTYMKNVSRLSSRMIFLISPGRNSLAIQMRSSSRNVKKSFKIIIILWARLSIFRNCQISIHTLRREERKKRQKKWKSKLSLTSPMLWLNWRNLLMLFIRMCWDKSQILVKISTQHKQMFMKILAKDSILKSGKSGPDNLKCFLNWR